MKSPAGLVITGFRTDLSRKRILYVFGFTRNNAVKGNKRIHALRFILMAGSGISGQNTCIHTQCVRYVKNTR